MKRVFVLTCAAASLILGACTYEPRADRPRPPDAPDPAAVAPQHFPATPEGACMAAVHRNYAGKVEAPMKVIKRESAPNGLEVTIKVGQQDWWRTDDQVWTCKVSPDGQVQGLSLLRGRSWQSMSKPQKTIW